MQRRHFLVSGLSLTLSGMSVPAMAAPEAKLWDRWLGRDTQSTLRIDHGAFASFLESYHIAGEDGIHRVAYGRVAARDRSGLDSYIHKLSQITVSDLNYTEQLAFWINLYNALTIITILAHYPVKSIRDIDISPGPFADGPWGAKQIAIGDTELSLDDIEHRIVRPIFVDARVHYALNCGAIGCPNLAKLPYAGDRIWIQLDQAARAFVNHPRGVSLSDGTLTLSKIYDWYQSDFGSNDAEVIRHLMAYADMKLAKELQNSDMTIDKYVYDWQLNEAS